MLRRIVIRVLLFSVVAGICAAQSKEDIRGKPETTFFRLDLVVKELDEGKVTNSRTFSTIGSTVRDAPPSVRAGSKIPISKGSGELTYTDVGVNVDYRALTDMGDSLAVIVTVDMTSIASSDTGSINDRLPPVIRQNRWNAEAIVPFRKSTMIFSSDDVTSKRKLQVDLTVTPIKQ